MYLMRRQENPQEDDNQSSISDSESEFKFVTEYSGLSHWESGTILSLFTKFKLFMNTDSLQRIVLPQTIYANEAYKEGYKGVVPC